METFKLTLVTLGMLAIIVGFFFVAFSLLKKKEPETDSCSTNTNNTRSFGCGCGSGACGLPVDRRG
jgi:hypothetical protein